MPLKQSSMAMAIHTPRNPIIGANNKVKDILTAQMLKRFINDGISVFPAPTNTPIATIAAAKPGSGSE